MLTYKTLAAPQFPRFIPETPETDDIREENIRLRKRINQLVRELYDFQKAIKEHLDSLNNKGVLQITQATVSNSTLTTCNFGTTCYSGGLTWTQSSTDAWNLRVTSDNFEFYTYLGVAGVKATITSGGDLLLTGDILRLATTKTPASATATGTTGDICWDSSYIYVAVGTDTWKRVAIATWP